MTLVDSDAVAGLQRVSLFTEVPAQTLAHLVKGGLLQRYPRGTVLFEQGQRPDFLHVLLDGSVQLVGSAGERESVIEVLNPVETFILAAVLTDTPYLVRAEVIRPSRVLLLAAPVLREQLTVSPELASTMLVSLARQFRMLMRQLKDLKLRNATQRLGCYLLALAGQCGSDEFDLPFDKRVLAERLGIARESLSRAIGVLREHGVRVRGRRVHIVERGQLAAFSRPDSLIDGADTGTWEVVDQ